MTGLIRGELADTYVSNHTDAEKPKHVSSAYVVNNGSKSPKMNAKSGGRFGQTFQAAKGQQFGKEIVCYNCQSKGHVARFCPQSSGARQAGQTASMSPSKVRRCYRCQSTQHLVRFCPKANVTEEAGDRTSETSDVQVNAFWRRRCIVRCACVCIQP